MSRRISRRLQGRLDPAGDGGVASHRQPPEREREPPQRPQAHLLHEQPGTAPGGACRPAPASCPVRPGGKLSNASQETGAMRPGGRRGPPATGLDNRPAGVVPDQRDVVGGRAARGTPPPAPRGARRQAGVTVHAVAMGGERQRRDDAPVAHRVRRATSSRARRPSAAGQRHDRGPSAPVSWFSIVPAESASRALSARRGRVLSRSVPWGLAPSCREWDVGYGCAWKTGLDEI